MPALPPNTRETINIAATVETVPNLLSILLLTGVVKRWTGEYADQGKLEPPAH